jgi:hypothetical protein
MFSNVLRDLRRPTHFLGIADTVALKFYAQFKIVLRLGTLLFGFKSNRERNALCVAVTHSLFLKNASITNLRCLPDHGDDLKPY